MAQARRDVAPRACPSAPRDGPAFPAFVPRAPWWGGDLQTVRNALAAPAPPPGGDGERLAFPMDDGTGDVLPARLHRPRAPAAGLPLVLLVHGLTGCEDSAYVRASACCFLRRGHPVLRLNLRGAGPARHLCRERYHAGRTEDLRAVLAALPGRLAATGMSAAEGAVAIGYSLGGNLLLKLLGEPGVPGFLRAAAAVSAPIDLAAAWRRLARPRNFLYRRWLLARIKEEALAAPGLPARDRAAVAAARTVRAFDDTFTAPRNGFADAGDYYARSSAAGFLSAIAVPTLLVHAEDDPWIPAAPYRACRWERAPACRLLLSARGGHVGFHGRGSATAWHDRCAWRFFESVCAGDSRAYASPPPASRAAAAMAK